MTHDEKQKKKLDSHKWIKGGVDHMDVTLEGKLQNRITRRICEKCQATDNPLTIQCCPSITK